MRYLTLIALLCVCAPIAAAQTANDTQPSDVRLTIAQPSAPLPLPPRPDLFNGLRAMLADRAATNALVEKLEAGQDPTLDELKKLRLILAENAKLKEENAGLKDEVAAKAGTIEQYKKIAATWKQTAADWEDAATHRKDANVIAQQIDTRLQADLDKTDAELLRTRKDLDSCRNPSIFRQLFSIDTLFKVGAGYAIGKSSN